jgi:hypothetical protein
MKGRVLWLAIVLVAGCVILPGCEREVPAFEDRTEQPEVDGYMIMGKLSDQFGNPLRDVPVVLYYDYVFVDANPPPSKTYQVTDARKPVLVRVASRSGVPFRVLFNDTISPGPLTVEWDQKDGAGNFVPSGVYFVQYLVENVVRMSYPVTVTGRVTAVTDSLGRFTIGNENLPIDFYPVPLTASDGSRYLGNHRIVPFVTLQFQLEGARRSVYVSLTKNQIKRLDLRF